jgi:hypothetical protein
MASGRKLPQKQVHERHRENIKIWEDQVNEHHRKRYEIQMAEQCRL